MQYLQGPDGGIIGSRKKIFILIYILFFLGTLDKFTLDHIIPRVCTLKIADI